MQQISGAKGFQNLYCFFSINVYYTCYLFFCSVQNAEVDKRDISWQQHCNSFCFETALPRTELSTSLRVLLRMFNGAPSS
jgi:hypothetical protein